MSSASQGVSPNSIPSACIRFAEDIEAVFLMPHEAYTYLSSRLVKEVALLGGTVKGLVSPLVERMLREKYDQYKSGRL